MPAPVLTITNVPAAEISNAEGMNVSEATFVSDADLEEWEARAGSGITSHGAGLLVGHGGELAANSAGFFDVQSSELSNGEGDYSVAVWGKGWDGYWNDGTRDQPKPNLPLLQQDGGAFQASDGSFLALNDGSYSRGYTSVYTGAQIDDFVKKVI